MPKDKAGKCRLSSLTQISEMRAFEIALVIGELWMGQKWHEEWGWNSLRVKVAALKTLLGYLPCSPGGWFGSSVFLWAKGICVERVGAGVLPFLTIWGPLLWHEPHRDQQMLFPRCDAGHWRVELDRQAFLILCRVWVALIETVLVLLWPWERSGKGPYITSISCNNLEENHF